MNNLLEFPQSALVNEKLHKKKLYEYISPSKKLKELFTQEVERVIWLYKLSPETTGVNTGINIEEVQVFSVDLKEKYISEEILKQIDRAIPSPIIFLLRYKENIQYTACLKTASSGYFFTEWFKENRDKYPLPVEGDLEKLYHNILKMIISLPEKKGETITELIQRLMGIKQRENEIKKLINKINREKQYKRQVELNSKVRTLKKELMELLNG